MLAQGLKVEALETGEEGEKKPKKVVYGKKKKSGQSKIDSQASPSPSTPEPVAVKEEKVRFW
jgi:hypothetical protein